MNTALPATFIGAADNNVEAAAVAVAGFESAVCKFTPMFMCNPYETSEPGSAQRLYDAITDQSLRRRLLRLRQVGGNGAQYFPGNFGLLVPPGDNNGAQAILDMVAQVAPPTCFMQSGVELKTGNIDPVRSAINTRFDIYEQSFNNKRNDTSYRPASNVRKGYSFNGSGANAACNASYNSDTTTYRGLTPDTCFETNSCPNDGFSPEMAGRIGDGMWDFEGYWSVNHPGRPVPNGWSNANPPTRFAVYEYEIATPGLLADASLGPDGPGPQGEKGTPLCSASTPDPNRRFLYAAILNCIELNNDPQYGPLNGASSSLLPVEAFAKFFITQPVLPNNALEPENEKKINVEFVDVVEPGVNNEIAKDIVQLYR
jgi:hypothetical protein